MGRYIPAPGSARGIGRTDRLQPVWLRHIPARRRLGVSPRQGSIPMGFPFPGRRSRLCAARLRRTFVSPASRGSRQMQVPYRRKMADAIADSASEVTGLRRGPPAPEERRRADALLSTGSLPGLFRSHCRARLRRAVWATRPRVASAGRHRRRTAAVDVDPPEQKGQPMSAPPQARDKVSASPLSRRLFGVSVARDRSGRRGLPRP